MHRLFIILSRHWRGVSASRNSHQGLAVLHKRCSTIEINTATKNATIKCAPCPLALCIKPGIVMGFCPYARMRFVVTGALVSRLTCRDSRRKVGLPPAQYSRTLRCFAECWLRDFDLTSRHLEKPRPMRGRCIGRGPLERSQHPTTDASPNSVQNCSLSSLATADQGLALFLIFNPISWRYGVNELCSQGRHECSVRQYGQRVCVASFFMRAKLSASV